MDEKYIRIRLEQLQLLCSDEDSKQASMSLSIKEVKEIFSGLLELYELLREEKPHSREKR